ncbi:MAG: hypothetical protein WB680_17240 [Candidatus Acidiferrales bacterium]
MTEFALREVVKSWRLKWSRLALPQRGWKIPSGMNNAYYLKRLFDWVVDDEISFVRLHQPKPKL